MLSALLYIIRFISISRFKFIYLFSALFICLGLFRSLPYAVQLMWKDSKEVCRMFFLIWIFVYFNPRDMKCLVCMVQLKFHNYLVFIYIKPVILSLAYDVGCWMVWDNFWGFSLWVCNHFLPIKWHFNANLNTFYHFRYLIIQMVANDIYIAHCTPSVKWGMWMLIAWNLQHRYNIQERNINQIENFHVTSDIKY